MPNIPNMCLPLEKENTVVMLNINNPLALPPQIHILETTKKADNYQISIIIDGIWFTFDIFLQVVLR